MIENLHFPLPRDEVKSMEEAIRKIRYLPTEHLYVFKNRKQVRRYVGESSFVNIPYEYLFELRDAVVIHNHPQGSTFSFEDVEISVKQNLKQLIVVTNQNIFSIKRPNFGWGIDLSNYSTRQILNSCESNARKMVEKLAAQFEVKNEEIEPLIFHYIWVFFFNMFNIEYVKKEHTKNSV